MKNFFPVLILLLILITGCSDKVRVSGYVKYPDGEPVPFGKVYFASKDKTFFANIKKDGYYAPGELQDGEGIPPGKYEVFLAETTRSEEVFNDQGEGTGKLITTDAVAQKYTVPGPDAIQFEVKKGGAKTLDITVERPSSGNKKK